MKISTNEDTQATGGGGAGEGGGVEYMPKLVLGECFFWHFDELFL